MRRYMIQSGNLMDHGVLVADNSIVEAGHALEDGHSLGDGGVGLLSMAWSLRPLAKIWIWRWNIGS